MMADRNQGNFLIRVDRVKQQLHRLSQLMARDQQFNNLHVRRLLERPEACSSQSDSDTSTEKLREINKMTPNVERKRLDSLETVGGWQQSNNDLPPPSATESSQSKDDDTMGFGFKLQCDLLNQNEQDQLISQSKQKNDRGFKKENVRVATAVGCHQHFLLSPQQSKLKSPKIKGKNLTLKKQSIEKPVKKLGQSSLGILERKKSGFRPPKNLQLPVKKSATCINTNSPTSLIATANGFAEKPTKLNKMTMNKYKEAQKQQEIQNNSHGLQQKLHLNLNEKKPLMQRLLQKKRFLKEYQHQTRRYQQLLQTSDEKQLLEQLSVSQSQFPYRTQTLQILMRFLAQFSRKLAKRLTNGQIERSDWQALTKQLWRSLNTLPSRLFKKNVVCQHNYVRLLRDCDELKGSFGTGSVFERVSRFKLVQILFQLKKYLEFLTANHLLQTTERNDLYSNRKIGGFYSHRSDGEAQEQVDSDLGKRQNKRKRSAVKGYETERKVCQDDPLPNSVAKAIPQHQLRKVNLNTFKDQLREQRKCMGNSAAEKFLQLSTRSGKVRSPDVKETKVLRC